MKENEGLLSPNSTRFQGQDWSHPAPTSGHRKAPKLARRSRCSERETLSPSVCVCVCARARPCVGFCVRVCERETRVYLCVFLSVCLCLICACVCMCIGMQRHASRLCVSITKQHRTSAPRPHVHPQSVAEARMS